MNITKSICALAAAGILLTAAFSKAALAEDLIVEHSPSSGHYPTIQAALDHAATVLSNPANNTSFRVVVRADPIPYSGPITPISNVPIIGSSTAGTFIDGNGLGVLINLAGVTSVSIRNLTFRNAAVGIAVSGSSAISITNNVFQLGSGGIAVQVHSSPSTSIINNTFVDNGTAISTDSDITISNDIFFRNSNAISTTVPLPQLSYSYFHNNSFNGVSDLGSHSIPNSLVPDQNPLFVDQANRDFHLQQDSPARGSGNPNYPNSFDSSSFDMGAYGGPNSDISVTAVTGASSALTPPDTITLSWNPAASQAVTAYRVYYGSSSRASSGSYNGSPPASQGPSPLTVPAPATTAVLSGFPVTPPAVPPPPTLTSVVPLNQSLMVSWTTSPGATGYRIYYSTADFDDANRPGTFLDVDGNNTTSTIVIGLSNGTQYAVAVAALAQNRIFAAVTAVVDPGVAAAAGSDNESPYSDETSQPFGPLQVSGISNKVQDFPEPFSPYPDFEISMGGCFIATAAYGSYFAPQVQVLREFRDRYLMSTAAGRGFVAWYYRHGPTGADFIDRHPWLKAPVRLLLLPLLMIAAFLVYTPPAAQLALLVFALAVPSVLYLRKRGIVPAQQGGVR